MKIKKTLKLDKEEYCLKHLSIINHFLPEKMTKKETEVLAAFISLEGDLAKEPFSTLGRQVVMKKIGINFSGGLGNHLRELRKKNFIVEVNGKEQILPILRPSKEEQEYSFKLEIDG